MKVKTLMMVPKHPILTFAKFLAKLIKIILIMCLLLTLNRQFIVIFTIVIENKNVVNKK